MEINEKLNLQLKFHKNPQETPSNIQVAPFLFQVKEVAKFYLIVQIIPIIIPNIPSSFLCDAPPTRVRPHTPHQCRCHRIHRSFLDFCFCRQSPLN